MAFTSAGFVEVRDTGAADNGGYWNPTIAGAGADLTQNDLPALSIADADCNNSTTVTSVTGGFTTQMIGNACHIAGAGYTTGWYEIRTRPDANTITIDRNPTSAGGHPTTGALKVGGAVTTIDAPLVTTITTSTQIHIKKGTYTFAACTLPTNSTSSIIMRGYKTNRNDFPQGADRPSITMTGTLTCGASNCIIADVIISGNFAANTVTLKDDSQLVNCKITQSNGTANITAIAGGGLTRNGIIGCEVIDGAGRAVNGVSYVHNCYIHDSNQGYYVAASNDINIITGCVFDTCATDGINASTAGRVNVIGCTIYNCADGIETAAGINGRLTVINTVITGCTVGIRMGTDMSILSNLIMNNGTDIISATGLQMNLTVADPLLKDPANGDFTIQAASPAKSAALQMNTNLGTVGTYYKSIGVSEIAPFLGQMMSVS